MLLNFSGEAVRVVPARTVFSWLEIIVPCQDGATGGYPSQNYPRLPMYQKWPLAVYDRCRMTANGKTLNLGEVQRLSRFVRCRIALRFPVLCQNEAVPVRIGEPGFFRIPRHPIGLGGESRALRLQILIRIPQSE